MHWIHLTGEDQLDQIVVRSQEKPQVIFKYSSLSLSSHIALQRLDEKCCPQSADFYFLDLVAYRSLSDKVAKLFSVNHEFPQVLLLMDGLCVYQASHAGIHADKLIQEVERYAIPHPGF